MPSEKTLTRNILRWLNQQPHSFFFKLHAGGWGHSGMPDIIGHSRGAFYAFEVKRPPSPGNRRGVLSPLQATTIDRINKTRPPERHQLAFVVQSLDEVRDCLSYDSRS
jgi:hypothetical protein